METGYLTFSPRPEPRGRWSAATWYLLFGLLAGIVVECIRLSSGLRPMMGYGSFQWQGEVAWGVAWLLSWAFYGYFLREGGSAKERASFGEILMTAIVAPVQFCFYASLVVYALFVLVGLVSGGPMGMAFMLIYALIYVVPILLVLVINVASYAVVALIPAQWLYHRARLRGS